MNLLDEKIYANAFSQIPLLGASSLSKISKYAGGFVKAWQTNPTEFMKIGLQSAAIDQIIATKPKINPEQGFAELTRRGIEIILVSEKSYPQLLKQIAVPPPMIYVRGQIQALNTPTIAIVGTRKMSSYGRAVCQEISGALAAAGITIVSGLAFGIDSVALTAAVENGRAIAVLASDLDDASISPRQNFQLAQKIMENGCVISEYPLGFQVQKSNFPVRNRIIAGLSLGTVVVEADEKSGALITSSFALEQNREVFAVPGSIFSSVSRGPNNLIKQGARVVTNAADILEELNLSSQPADNQTFESTQIEEQILEFLTREPIHIDDLIKSSQLAPQTINANLTLLEMKGRVKNLGGAKYVKVR